MQASDRKILEGRRKFESVKEWLIDRMDREPTDAEVYKAYRAYEMSVDDDELWRIG